MPEGQVDTTLPKAKGIEKRAGHLIQEWRQCFAEHQNLLMQAPVAKKRMGESQAASASTAAKRKKTEYGESTVDDLRRAIKNNHLEKLTLPVLKQVIKDFPDDFKGEPLSQKKTDLIDYIKGSLK